MRREGRPPIRSTLRSASVRRALEGPLWKGGSAHMDGNKRRPLMMAGLDLGDRYSHLCLIDQHSGEVVEEGRLRTSPEAFERRSASERPPMRIAIETGTLSPWVSRLLEECGHEVLVANARKLRLIYANRRKTDEVDAENLAWRASIRSCSTRSSTGAKRARPT